MRLTPYGYTAEVISVQGGRNTVRLIGKSGEILHMPSTNPCTEGQILPVKYVNGDPQQPILIAPERIYRKMPFTVSAVSFSWYQFHGERTCARAVPHKICGDTMANFTEEWSLEVTS